MQLEGLGQLKNLMTSSELEPMQIMLLILKGGLESILSYAVILTGKKGLTVAENMPYHALRISTNNNNNLLLFNSLFNVRAELNSQWPVTESARIQ
jgi:hypothetical protein